MLGADSVEHGSRSCEYRQLLRPLGVSGWRQLASDRPWTLTGPSAATDMGLTANS